MNKYMLWLAVLLLCVLAFTACDGEKDIPDPDPNPTPTEKTTNDWIYETMLENYLWYDEIEKKEAYNFSLTPDKFFESLLSENDGLWEGNTGRRYNFHFSYIEKKRTKSKAISDLDPTYGFEFYAYGIAAGQNTYLYVRVLYVLPGSAAAEAGLKRGDMIVGLDGKADNLKDYALLEDGNGVTLSIGDVQSNSEGYITGTTVTHIITLSAARLTENNPLFLDTVYHIGNNKIGYLVYNHFSSGPKDSYEDKTYDNEMKSIFKNFKSEGVNEFVLDLRYNGGGLVSCAQTLASCLAPSDIIKDSKNYFCIMKNNGKSTAKASNSYYPFNSSLTSSNLNLTKKRLYVLTGRWSASSSEAVINALKPFMDVILIGEQTLGKAVGSILFGDGDEGDKYDWIMHPIVMSICNHDGDYAYSQKGFTPDVLNDEYGLPFVKFCQLGDTNETLLSTALALIAGQTLSAPALRSSASMPTLEPVYSSVGRHVPQGLIFDEGMLEMAK